MNPLDWFREYRGLVGRVFDNFGHYLERNGRALEKRSMIGGGALGALVGAVGGFNEAGLGGAIICLALGGGVGAGVGLIALNYAALLVCCLMMVAAAVIPLAILCGLVWLLWGLGS